MKQLFSSLDKKTFSLLAIVFCVAGDLAIGTSIYQEFAVFEHFNSTMEEMFAIAAQGNPEIKSQLTPEMKREFFGLIRMTVVSTLTLVALLHASIYLCFWFQKKFAIYYVKMMAWLGPIVALLMGLRAFQGSPFYGYFFIQIFLFVFVAYGIKYFRLGQEQN